jgi:cysteine desulfurase family protein (TIGR01976 family)
VSQPDFNLDAIRARFPAFGRRVDGHPAAFFDGPAGSQVPASVAQAVSAYLLQTNANHGGPFATARESDALLDRAHGVLGDFLGADDRDCVVFGANMTTITLAVSRALARTWTAGDEVLVTHLDHDANVTPWVLAAESAGARVQRIDIHPDDCTLDLDDFRNKLSERTRLVAVGYASNAVGTVNPIVEMTRAAHEVGALVYVDAVHYAPHGRINVADLGCDFLVCSAYKFFGPHVGVLWGRRSLLESLRPDKLRPAPDTLPGKWMTGTQSHEGIAGAAAAVEYIAGLASSNHDDRPEALDEAFAGIARWERQLVTRLLEGLQSLKQFRIWGPLDVERRVPTVSVTHERLRPLEIADWLGRRGLFCWPGNHYALPLTERLGLEPDGTLRIGLLHYNTLEEVDRLLEALADFD